MVSPALVLGVFWLVSPALGVVEKVAVLQAAMAPMVTAGVLAGEQKLEPALAAALVAVGVPVSFLSVAVWWWLIR